MSADLDYGETLSTQTIMREFGYRSRTSVHRLKPLLGKPCCYINGKPRWTRTAVDRARVALQMKTPRVPDLHAGRRLAKERRDSLRGLRWAFVEAFDASPNAAVSVLEGFDADRPRRVAPNARASCCRQLERLALVGGILPGGDS